MTKALRCDGSKSDCNKAIKEILRLENRWEELKKTLHGFKDTRLVQEVSAKTAVQIILNEMKQLEEK